MAYELASLTATAIRKCSGMPLWRCNSEARCDFPKKPARKPALCMNPSTRGAGTHPSFVQLSAHCLHACKGSNCTGGPYDMWLEMMIF